VIATCDLESHGDHEQLLALAIARYQHRRSPVADCVCVTLDEPIRATATATAAARGASRFQLVRASEAECRSTAPTALALTISRVHWLSSGLTSFARGVNDAPKIGDVTNRDADGRSWNWP
jgi:hypothetical protein